MSGAVQAAAGITAAASYSYRITPGNNLSVAGLWGYSFAGANPGSLSPITTLKGKVIELLRSDASADDLIIQLASPGVAQNFWRSVMVQTSAGSWRQYLSSAATFSGGLQWTFGTGSDPVWTNATPGGVIFFV